MINIFGKPKHKRRAPRRGERGRITKTQYSKALEEFGEGCGICGSSPIEMHHIVFRSQGGRGGYRNLIPLCQVHHLKAHQKPDFANQLAEERKERFGKYFSCDRFDLFEHGHIDDPNEDAFENYMREKENK